MWYPGQSHKANKGFSHRLWSKSHVQRTARGEIPHVDWSKTRLLCRTDPVELLLLVHYGPMAQTLPATNEDQSVQILYKADLAIRPRAKLRTLKSKKRALITDEQYADDTVTAESFETLQLSTKILDKTIADLGGEISLPKTEWMRVPPRTDDIAQELKLRGETLKETDSFVYLGATLANSPEGHHGAHEETRLRIMKAGAAFGRLRGVWRTNLSNKTKGRLFQACVGSTLLYAAETKTITYEQQEAMRRFWYGCIKSIMRMQMHTSYVRLLEDFGIPDVRILIKRRTANIM